MIRYEIQGLPTWPKHEDLTAQEWTDIKQALEECREKNMKDEKHDEDYILIECFETIEKYMVSKGHVPAEEEKKVDLTGGFF